MEKILAQYQALLQTLDGWFAACLEQNQEQIVCRTGCTGCCRGLFEISLLDAALLQAGFSLLDSSTRSRILAKAQIRIDELQARWPEFQPPYILNHLPHAEWQEMPEGDLTPCPLLSSAGTCLVYAHRPMTCRLHGLPNIDLSGESFSDEYCTLNFTASNPLTMPELRHPFRETFTREFALLGAFSQQLTGQPLLEIDTFIPSALMINFTAVQWPKSPQQKDASD